MSVMRIGEVQAKAEMVEALRDFLISIIPMIKASEGCESCQLLQREDDTTTFVIIEVWDSVQSHHASVNNIPPEKLGEIRPLLASPPKGAYYGVVAHT
jgi:quinol monooxygenase YgiN